MDAVAVVVAAVVDGLIHSKCDYPEKQEYKNVIWRENFIFALQIRLQDLKSNQIEIVF